jgi:hypothetical protein
MSQLIELEVSVVDQSGVVGWLSGVRAQLPYATSVAINRTLDTAQAAIRTSLPEHFTIRRKDFIERTIYIGPKDRARKDNLIGTVRVNPERDFLAKFETGGEKHSKSGKALAVPVIRARDKTMIIRRSDPLALKKLLEAIDARGGKVKQRRKKGQPPPTAMGDVFILKTAKGTLVMQRPVSGPDRVGNRSNLKVLYAFKDEVPIDDDLHFAETAMKAAVGVWNKNFLDAIDLAMGTAR